MLLRAVRSDPGRADAIATSEQRFAGRQVAGRRRRFLERDARVSAIVSRERRMDFLAV